MDRAYRQGGRSPYGCRRQRRKRHSLQPRRQVLAALGGDQTIRLLDAGEFQQAGPAIDVSAAGSQGMALSADSGLIAAAGRDGIIQLRNITTRHQVSVQGPPRPDRGSLVNMVFSSDQKTLAIEAENGLMVLDVSRRRRIFYGTARPGYLGVALSPDGKILASTQYPTDPCRCGNGHRVSTNGKILATGNGQGTVWLWMIAAGRQIGQAIWVGALSRLKLSEFTFSPDGSLLATAGGYGTVRLWDIATQRQVGPTMNASTAGGVNAVSFSRDSSLLASAGATERSGYGMSVFTCRRHRVGRTGERRRRSCLLGRDPRVRPTRPRLRASVTGHASVRRLGGAGTARSCPAAV